MRWVRRAQRARVIVHTTDDQTFDGVLTCEARDGLVLTAASLLDGQAAVPLGGETFIPREKVSFLQRPTPLYTG